MVSSCQSTPFSQTASSINSDSTPPSPKDGLSVQKTHHQAHQTQSVVMKEEGSDQNSKMDMKGTEYTLSKVQYQLPSILSTMEKNVETAVVGGMHPSRLQLLSAASSEEEHLPWNVAAFQEYVKQREEVMGSENKIADTCSNVSSEIQSDVRAAPQAQTQSQAWKNYQERKSKQKNSLHQVENYIILLNKAYTDRKVICDHEDSIERLRKGAAVTRYKKRHVDKLRVLISSIESRRQTADQSEYEAVGNKPPGEDIDGFLATRQPGKKTEKFLTYFIAYRKKIRKANEYVKRLEASGFADLSTALQLIIETERLLNSLRELIQDGLLDFESQSTLKNVTKLLEDNSQRHLTSLGLKVSEAEEILKRVAVKSEVIFWPSETSQLATKNPTDWTATHQDRKGDSAQSPIDLDAKIELSEDTDTLVSETDHELKRPMFMIDSAASTIDDGPNHGYDIAEV